MEANRFSYILNDHFVVRYITARDGNDTPSDFHCRKGLRKWSRFFYLAQGEIDFVSHTGHAFTLKKGDILFLPYDIEYNSSWTDAENGHYFSVEFILEYPGGEMLNIADELMIVLHDKGYFRELFLEISQTMKAAAIGCQLRLQEQFMHLLYQLAMAVRKKSIGGSDIGPAVLAIEADLRAETDVEKLAKICHLSPATLRRRFLALFGVSPIRYRNSLRLRKARELLKTGLYTVGEAAELVGIPDLSYFSKLYKREFGLAPREDV